MSKSNRNVVVLRILANELASAAHDIGRVRWALTPDLENDNADWLKGLDERQASIMELAVHAENEAVRLGRAAPPPYVPAGSKA